MFVDVTPETLQRELDRAQAGSTIRLNEGRYRKPVTMRNRSGRAGAPIVITADEGAVFDGAVTFEDFKPVAEAEARRTEEAGSFPGLYEIADQGMLRLVDCRWVELRGLRFRRYWPTHVYLRHCQDIRMIDLTLEDATFAIYAEREDTGRLEVIDSRWTQDVTEKLLWKDLLFDQVHGDSMADGEGGRAFDGAFFRSRNISGDVLIRGNTIRHATNGVHMFNRREGPVWRVNNNVQIIDNDFEYIKDNAIEPERHAVNWWVAGNRIFNAHKWFSFQLFRGGHFYVFANVGWFDDLPGPPEEENNGGSVFKFPGDIRESPWPSYVFHNSWYLRSSYVKKKRFRNLRHWNNAIAYCISDAGNSHMCSADKPFFGKGATTPPTRPVDEGEQFTIEWDALDIHFEDDLVRHWDWPNGLRCKGYPIVPATDTDPGFIDGPKGNLRRHHPGSDAAVGRRMVMEMPDETFWLQNKGAVIGAYAGHGEDAPLYQGPAYRRWRARFR